MPLTEAQMAVLDECEQGKVEIENTVAAYNRLLRQAREWHDGNMSFLVPENLTDADVVATLRTRANAQRQAIIDAANALREV